MLERHTGGCTAPACLIASGRILRPPVLEMDPYGDEISTSSDGAVTPQKTPMRNTSQGANYPTSLLPSMRQR